MARRMVLGRDVSRIRVRVNVDVRTAMGSSLWEVIAVLRCLAPRESRISETVYREQDRFQWGIVRAERL